MYFGYKSLVRYTMCKNFIQFCAMSFHLLHGIFEVQKIYLFTYLHRRWMEIRRITVQGQPGQKVQLYSCDPSYIGNVDRIKLQAGLGINTRSYLKNNSSKRAGDDSSDTAPIASARPEFKPQYCQFYICIYTGHFL
jgi:hypothetical protein